MLALSSLVSTHEVTLDFEDYVQNDLGISLALQRAAICRNYTRGHCPLGGKCPLRHPPSSKKVVCKHWLRGLCKKGDACEFLHEYNMRKMPECWFFSKYGECSNPDCVYLHVDPASKVRECPWFARGFCKHGPNCKNKHVKKIACMLYLTGFCPSGSECANGHPKFEVLTVDDEESVFDNSMPAGHSDRLDHIVCFKCGRKGHFANHCPLSGNKRQQPGATQQY